MKTLSLLAAAFAAAVAASAASVSGDEAKSVTPSQPEKKSDTMKMTKTPSGLQYEDIQVGTGASPTKGQTCVVHYTGWLWENGAKGEKFDSSVDRGTPIAIPIGVGRVIKGWDEGVMTMKVGGKRILLIPPDLGYGSTGKGKIPPNATLLFEVELIEIK